jgi:hypothetical protein
MNADPVRLRQLLTGLRARLTSHLAHEESDALPLIGQIMSPGELGAIARAIGGRHRGGHAARTVPWALAGANANIRTQALGLCRHPPVFSTAPSGFPATPGTRRHREWHPIRPAGASCCPGRADPIRATEANHVRVRGCPGTRAHRQAPAAMFGLAMPQMRIRALRRLPIAFGWLTKREARPPPGGRSRSWSSPRSDATLPGRCARRPQTPTGLSDFKHFDQSFAPANRLRTDGTNALLAAAREAHVGRFVAQSCRVLAHNYRVGDWPLASYPRPKIAAGVGHKVADRVPDQGAEFGAGDVVERVSGHEQPSEHCAQ